MFHIEKLLLAAVIAVSCQASALAWGWHHESHRHNWYGDRHNSAGNGASQPASAAIPNLALTPGAVDSSITQANLAETICRPGGYTRSVRPPEEFTENLKRRQIVQYGYADARMGDWEEDHDIPLALAGAPSDPRNLWPEPRHPAGGWGASAKDQLELRLHDLVCQGRVPLLRAQQEIRTNWIAAYKRYVAPTPRNESHHFHEW